MACEWISVGYGVPPSGKQILMKYNEFRSDSPFKYVVGIFNNGWMTQYMFDGYISTVQVPEPDYWAFIETGDKQ